MNCVFSPVKQLDQSYPSRNTDYLLYISVLFCLLTVAGAMWFPWTKNSLCDQNFPDLHGVPGRTFVIVLRLYSNRILFSKTVSLVGGHIFGGLLLPLVLWPDGMVHIAIKLRWWTSDVDPRLDSIICDHPALSPWNTSLPFSPGF